MDMKSLALPEHIFNSLWHRFHVLILKKSWYYSFSFDSNSVNDEWQPQINLLDRSCTCTIDFVIGTSRLKRPTWAWHQLLLDHSHYFKLSAIAHSAIGTVSSSCLICRQVSIEHQWLSETVTHNMQNYCQKRNHQDMFLLKNAYAMA
jgi:hypothetical protein